MDYRYIEISSAGRCYRLDLAARELYHESAERVPLTRKQWALLKFLVHQQPRKLVTKDELLQNVWPGIIVDEETVAKTVGAVRKALQDSRANPTFIETAYGDGYRFIADIKLLSEGSPISERVEDNNSPSTSEAPWINLTFYLKENDIDDYINNLYGLLPADSIEPLRLFAQGDDRNGLKSLRKIVQVDGAPTELFLSPRIHALSLVQFRIRSLELSRLEIDDSDAIWQWGYNRNGVPNPHSEEIAIHCRPSAATDTLSNIIERRGCIHHPGKNGFVYLDRRFLQSYSLWWFRFLGLPTDGIAVSWDYSHGIRADTETVYVQFFPSAETVARDLLEKSGYIDTVTVDSLDLDKIYFNDREHDDSGVFLFLKSDQRCEE